MGNLNIRETGSWISFLKVGAPPTKSHLALSSFGVLSSSDTHFGGPIPFFALMRIKNSTLKNNLCGGILESIDKLEVDERLSTMVSTIFGLWEDWGSL